MRALVHIALLLAAGITALLVVSPADAGDGLPPQVQVALERAATLEGARVDAVLEGKLPAGCAIDQVEVPRPLDGSGRFAVRVAGAGRRGACEAWLWVRVRLFADVPVATRTIAPGEPIAAAVAFERRELRGGQPPAERLAGAVAVRRLNAGRVILSGDVQGPAVRLGTSIKVVAIAGALTVEQIGRAVPCTRGRTCAVLPSGKRVEGDLVDGRLLVEAP